MSVHDRILAANARFAAGFTARNLPSKPRWRVAVVTCMDGRTNPMRLLGLRAGDAHVIRNAGAVVTDDVLRSLVISHYLLATEEALVIGHTECGMLRLTEKELRAKIANKAGVEASAINFLFFSDLERSVAASVRQIRDHPPLSRGFAVTGFVYDVRTGRLRTVEDDPRSSG